MVDVLLEGGGREGEGGELDLDDRGVTYFKMTKRETYIYISEREIGSEREARRRKECLKVLHFE